MAKYAPITRSNPATKNGDSKAAAGSTLSDRHLQSSETVDDPALIHKPFVLMEELLEKLKVVNYDVNFCRALKYKPISRHYFALATNPGEQFDYFVSLAAWLLTSCGRKMDQPQESDDPNATIAVILDGIRALGYKPDFPPVKLKTGCGEQCIWVLDCLCDYILKLQQFAFKTPEYPAEEEEKAEIVEECENVASDCDDVSHLARDDYDDDSDVVGLDELRQLGLQLDAGAGDANDFVTREMLQSNVVDSEWKLEVERILPQLKTAVETESKEQDWRYHVHQMHKYSEAIESCMKDTGSQLERLSNDINKTLEKIAGRERYLNDELYCRLNWLRSAHDRRAEKKNTYRQVSVRLADMSKYLAELGEELNRVRQEIEDRGNSMADGAPLVKIKQAITRTRQETMEMDIRVGLLQHIVLRQTLNARLQLRDTAAANSAAAFLD